MASAGIVAWIAAACAAPVRDGAREPSIRPRTTTIGSPERRLVEWIEARRGEIRRDLSGLRDAGASRAFETMERELRRLGFEREAGEGGGLIGRRRGDRGSRVLIVGPEPREAGALAAMLFALRALAEEGMLIRANVTVVLPRDESRSLRNRVAAEAGAHDVAAVFDPAPAGTLRYRTAAASAALAAQVLGISMGLGVPLEPVETRLPGPAEWTGGKIPSVESLGAEADPDAAARRAQLAAVVLYRMIR